MRAWEEVLYSVIEENEFFETLGEVLDGLNVSVAEFCEGTDLSESTMYKILSGHRQNIQLENFRKIVDQVRLLEQGRQSKDRTVAVITNRESFERVQNELNVRDLVVSLERYPVATVEEAIKQSILAEQDGVDAIVCGPITAYTIEDVIHIPVIGLSVESKQIFTAVENAVNKM